MDHRRTRSGRADDGVRFTLFEDADEALGHLSCLVTITGVECWLTAARLPIVKLNVTPNAPQHRHGTGANAGPHLIDQARDEEGNFHRIGSWFFVLRTLYFVSLSVRR